MKSDTFVQNSTKLYCKLIAKPIFNYLIFLLLISLIDIYHESLNIKFQHILINLTMLIILVNITYRVFLQLTCLRFWQLWRAQLAVQKPLVPLTCTSQNNELLSLTNTKVLQLSYFFNFILELFLGELFNWKILKNYLTNLYETSRGYLVAYKESK